MRKKTVPEVAMTNAVNRLKTHYSATPQVVQLHPEYSNALIDVTTCMAITVSAYEIPLLFWTLREHLRGEHVEIAQRARTHQVGEIATVYFPGCFMGSD